MLAVAERTAAALMKPLSSDGRLPGRIRPDLQAAVAWTCLTGVVQLAWCWLRLGALTGKAEYLEAGRRANRFVRRTVLVDGPVGLRGGVKGSQPIDGGYGPFQYLNWACKFFVDAQLLETELGPR